MNPLRSKKSRQSSTTIIDLSLNSDDDDDNECSDSSALEHGNDKRLETLSTPTSKVVSLPKGKQKVATETPTNNFENFDADYAKLPVTKDPPQESEPHHSTSKQNSARNCKDTMLQPEVTTSINNITCTSAIANDDGCQLFDADDYSSLFERYLTQRIRNKPELPDGMILRRQYRGRIIDANIPLYRKLRVKVDALLKKKNHEEVYRLLCQLRIWELDPRRVPAIFQSNVDDNDVVEVFDLTKSNDEQSCIECINVDDYIAETATKLCSSIPEVVPSGEQDEHSETNNHRDWMNTARTSSLPNDCCAAPKDIASPSTRYRGIVTVDVNAPTSLDTHSTRIKLSKTTFHKWLATKKISWRRRRNKSSEEQKITPLIWSPSSLRKSSLLVKPTPAEKLQFKESNKHSPLNVVNCETGYSGKMIPSDVLAAPSMNELTVVTPTTSSRSCDIRESDPSTLTTFSGSPIVAVVTPDGKNPSRDTFSIKENVHLSKKRRPIKRRLYHADEKFTRDPQLSSPFCAFNIYDFGFPYSNKKTSRERSIDLINEASSRVRHAHTGRMKRRRILHHERSTDHNFKYSIIPHSRIEEVSRLDANIITTSLHEDWNRQIKKRKKGEWVPSGHVTGRWKPPVWADVKRKQESIDGADSISSCKQKKSPGCRKSLLPILDGIMKKYAVDVLMHPSGSSFSSHHASSLQDVICPQYVKPTIELLRNAHAAVRSLLPDGDCEEWEVVELARSYYNYWRPKETKVILLAESHAFTSKDRALDGLDKDILNAYVGPREFISLVYCLSYGENESLTVKMTDKTNKGTPQFWTLLAACARGVEHIACAQKPSSSPFATDLLKVGQLSVEERLQAKLEVLENLRRRGIWLIDTSVFGWYISQPQAYTRSRISNEVHRKQKSRPPSELKVPSLVLSWELFTKHVVREVADEGFLKYLIPIGMEVEAAVTRRRMEDAIRSKKSEEAQVSDTFPAPNAWIPGGYGPFHAKLATLVNEAAPRSA